MAVVMASSDMQEILSLSHRAFVMSGGVVTGQLDRVALSAPDVQDTIFRLASGLDPRPDSDSDSDFEAATSISSTTRKDG